LNGLQPTAVVEARAQRDILLSNTLKVIKLTFVGSAVGVPAGGKKIKTLRAE
jgi:hypothetical protein